MWATYPKMQEALDLIEAWGFKYKSIAFQWIKQNRSGNGYFSASAAGLEVIPSPA